MKILLITAWYFPFTHPRPHRWTALAEYWAAQGHTVHVVTARQRMASVSSFHKGVQIHRVGFDSLKELFYFFMGDKSARGRVGAPVRKPGFTERFFNYLYKKIWKNTCFPDDACLWYWPAKRKIMSLMETEQMDLVCSVSLPFTGQLLGRAVHRRYPKVSWLADVGDPFSFEGFPLNNRFLYGRLNSRLERNILEQADAVVVTTALAKAQYSSAFGSAVVRHMHVIPPLLHPAPDGLRQRAFPNREGISPATTFKIGYFGAMYAPVRTPYAFLDLLEATLERLPDTKSRLEVHFYGEIFPEFYEALRQQPLVRLHGLQSRETIRAAMQEMDALLHIGNQTSFQLPSKAVEYAASGKPVLNLSYTETDAFAAFWGEREGLLTLKVKNGKVETASVQAWLDCLERKWPQQRLLVDPAWLKSFLVEQVAGAYMALFAAPRQ